MTKLFTRNEKAIDWKELSKGLKEGSIVLAVGDDTTSSALEEGYCVIALQHK